MVTEGGMTLTRTRALRAKPRSKGNRAELEIVHTYRDHGWTGARRNWQSGGQGGGDIINGPADTSTEVKHHETARIWEWIAQCEEAAKPTDIALLLVRSNKVPWFAVIPVDEWEALLAIQPAATTTVTVGPGQRLSLWKHLRLALDAANGLSGAIPTLQFSRTGSGVYVAVPLGEVLVRLRLRETAP